jgi:gliding motility-associated-like protein
MKKLFPLFYILFFSINLFGQMGKHGALTVNTPNFVINEYTSLSLDANAGSQILTVQSNQLNANNRFSGPLEQGDLLMIIQMQGVSLNVTPVPWDSLNSWPWDETWGTITNYNNCGHHEFVEVVSVLGNNQIIIGCGLQHNYTASGKVQVIRVPRYVSLTIQSSGEITSDTWNGSFGGVVSIEVMNDVVIQSGGLIHADFQGFRGGEALLNTSDHSSLQWGYLSPSAGAEKGEGVYGYKHEYDALGGGRYCRGAGANAGGGANNHNAGGGGGGNGGNVAQWSGKGVPSLLVPAWASAWNLEETGFSTHNSSGGGKGGYSYSSQNRDALTLGPWEPNWGGDLRRVVGGLGGRPLDYSTGRIFLGGGGGAGHQNDSYGGNGGNGGGIVYILGYGNISGSGSISSNGQNGFPAVGPTPGWNQITGIDGAGGAGAGGTVLLNVIGTISGISISANGGNGGNQIIQKHFMVNNNEAEGPGGGGGGGHIAISNGNPARQALGGMNGTTNSAGMTEFLPNGATMGGMGEAFAQVSQAQLDVSNVSACIGDTVLITATISGQVNPSSTVMWWDTQFGGNLLHTGIVYSMNNIAVSDTVWVGICPGWYRIPVVITVSGPICQAMPDTAICLGDTIMLNASGGVTYEWSPSLTLSNPNIQNPLAFPLTTTSYQVTAYEGVCHSVDSVTIHVIEVIGGVHPDTIVCPNESVQLHAWGGTTYQWTPTAGLSNALIQNPIAQVSNSTIYYVSIADSNGCAITDSVSIQLFPLQLLNLGADTTLCVGDSMQLNAGSAYHSYQWSTGSTNQMIVVNTEANYSVIVTDSNSCWQTDSIFVTFIPYHDASISSPLSFCDNDDAFQLTAQDMGGIWYGQGIIDSLTGLFHPGVAGAGIHEISYNIFGFCGDADTVNITVFNAPLVNLGNNISVCDGDTVPLDAGAGFTEYLWTPFANTQHYSVTTQGMYSVIVTDSNQCQATDSIFVSYLPLADAGISPTPPFCSNEPAQQLNANSGGGIWAGTGISNTSNGTFDPSIAGAGTHEITYTIAGQCGDSDTITIVVYSAPNVSVETTQETCIDAEDAFIILHIENGTPPYHYQWNTGDTTPILESIPSGTYLVSISDQNFCLHTEQIIISPVFNDCYTPHAWLPNIFSPNQDGINDIFKVRGQGIIQMELMIYNRWGELLFETSNQETGWNGKFNNNLVEPGVYTYYLNIRFNDNTYYQHTGNVTVVY